MKYNCDDCGKEFEFNPGGPCAIALAYCEDCGEKLMKTCPQLQEFMEELKDKEDVQTDS